MRGKATDAETIAKVVEEKLNNPDMSSRDIEKETGVNYRTAARIVEEGLSQVVSKSERAAAFLDANDRIISIGQKLLENYIPSVEIEGMSDLNSLASILEKAHKQNALARGESTDKVDGSFTIKWQE